jgi:lysophospholipase L1-like esterase
MLSFSSPTTSGGSAPVSITCTPASGALFASGATTVTCTATDAGGRSAMCGFGVSVSAVPTIGRTRFMAFGDSLTEGKVSLAPVVLVDAGPHSYPARLRTLLSARYTSQAITVANEGRGGERADESVSRFREALSVHRPEVVLLMHGVNDLVSATPGRVQSAADAVEELIKETRNAGAAALVATLPPFGSGPKASCPECIEPYNTRIRAIAAAKGATLVDVHAAWRSELMGADGIHPTEAGYEVIANAFFEAIRRTLENPMGDAR